MEGGGVEQQSGSGKRYRWKVMVGEIMKGIPYPAK